MANTCLFAIMFTHVYARLVMNKNTMLCIFESIICTIFYDTVTHKYKAAG